MFGVFDSLIGCQHGGKQFTRWTTQFIVRQGELGQHAGARLQPSHKRPHTTAHVQQGGPPMLAVGVQCMVAGGALTYREACSDLGGAQ